MSHPNSPSDRAPANTDLPSPPFINAPGLVNMRDAGGYAIQSNPGKVIRRGVLFRSAHLNDLGDEGISTLKQLGITQVFDLRSRKEHGGEALKTWEGANRIFAPVFLDEDYSPAAIAARFGQYGDGPEGFVKAYASILATAAHEDHPSKPFQTILHHLASPTVPSPVLIHCSAGKDRKWPVTLLPFPSPIFHLHLQPCVIVALILALCGLEDEVIAHEYSLTNLGLAPRREAIVQRLTVYPFQGDRERAEKMVSAPKEVMLQTLKFLRKEYGSVEDYVLDKLHISQATVEQLRKNLVVDLAEGEKALDWRSHAGLLEKPHL
ncbi:hypothetical protein N657DRAFT_679931 [Parathielavia appendiculata]|uniref:Tyrosine specific protein phosphatases domain-containing protein n=1 Tax=Parathielavia appendiculata TaxID=2587402 RepID=A0AAN6Z5Q0_9PEZI|nr:hypothetical protein N657DRAFT_679931 [Parathielavia appendiculata]